MSAALCHFGSVANPLRFTGARNRLAPARDETAGTRAALQRTLRDLARDEIDLACRLDRLTRADSRSGHEASNHYFSVPVDLIEKVVNCQYVLERLEDSGTLKNQTSPRVYGFWFFPGLESTDLRIILDGGRAGAEVERNGGIRGNVHPRADGKRWQRSRVSGRVCGSCWFCRH